MASEGGSGSGTPPRPTPNKSKPVDCVQDSSHLSYLEPYRGFLLNIRLNDNTNYLGVFVGFDLSDRIVLEEVIEVLPRWERVSVDGLVFLRRDQIRVICCCQKPSPRVPLFVNPAVKRGRGRGGDNRPSTK